MAFREYVKNILAILVEKGDAQKNMLFCVRFRSLRYSKAPEIC